MTAVGILAMVASVSAVGGLSAEALPEGRAESSLAASSDLFGAGAEKTQDGQGRIAVLNLKDQGHLGIARWLPEGPTRGVILALHGINDYGANSFQYMGPDMARRGYAVYALDQRGHGRSSDRGTWPSQAQSLSDLKAVLDLLGELHGADVKPILVGESMGGAYAVVAAATPELGARISKLVLMAPALQGWDEQPWHRKLAARTIGVVLADVPIVVPEIMARLYSPTNNEHAFQQMLRDPLLIHARRLSTMSGLLTLSTDARQRLRDVKVPVFLLYGGKDRLVPEMAISSAVQGLKPKDRSAYYPEGWHVLNRDLYRAEVFEDIARFLDDPLAPLPSGARTVPEALGPRDHVAVHGEKAVR